jgi:hypothetical protein
LERQTLQIRQNLRKIIAYFQCLSWYILAVLTIVFIIYFKYFYFHILSLSTFLFAFTLLLFGVQTLEKIVISLDEKNEVFNTRCQGELAIANILQKLPPEYFILHDFKIKASKKIRINHLVIGPTGIFVIQVGVFKRGNLIKGRTNVNKRLKRITKRVNDKAVFLSQLIKKVTGQEYPVKPILALTPNQPPSYEFQKVILTRLKRLNECLMSNPIILDNAQIKRLAIALEIYFSTN